MKLRPTRRTLILTALLLVTLLVEAYLFIFMREAVKETIILPLASMFFEFNRILRSIDQVVYWAILVVIGLLLLYTFAAQVIGPPTGRPAKFTSGWTNSRFRNWRHYLESFDNSNFASENLAFELSRLIANIYALHEELTPGQVLRLAEDGTLNLPPEIRELLRTRRFATIRPKQTWIDKLFRRKRSQQTKLAQHTPAHAEVEMIIAFIEQELEVSRDTENN